MSQRLEPYTCGECGTGKVRPTKAPYEVEVENERYTVQAVEQLRCDSCGAVSFTASQLRELDRRSACFVRTAKNLVGPDDIRELRDRLGLTQAELEGILRVSPKSVARWEAGVVHQNRGIDAMLRVHLTLAMKAPQLVECLRHDQLVQFLTQLPELLPDLLVKQPAFSTVRRGLAVEVQCSPVRRRPGVRYEAQTRKTRVEKRPNVRLAAAA